MAAFFWSLYVVPETRGVSLEEMDSLFNSDSGKESMKAKEEVSHVLSWGIIRLQIPLDVFDSGRSFLGSSPVGSEDIGFITISWRV